VFEESGGIRDFPGNYTDYRNFLSENNDLKSDIKTQTAAVPAKAETPPTAPKRKLSYKEQKELEGLDAEMTGLEKQKEAFIEKLNGGSGSHEDLIQWAREIENINAKIEEKEMRWLELSELA
jgi:ATP-binding cassette subfamily F protein uup